MSSSTAIPVPLDKTALEAFCSTNDNVSPTSLVKLAFATVLHHYFDLAEFTCIEATAKDHDGRDQGHTGYLITGSRQVRYVPELASTVSIREALRNSAPVLVDGAATQAGTATVNGGQVKNKRPTASLVLIKTIRTPAEALFSSLSAQLVSDLEIVQELRHVRFADAS